MGSLCVIMTVCILLICACVQHTMVGYQLHAEVLCMKLAMV